MHAGATVAVERGVGDLVGTDVSVAVSVFVGTDVLVAVGVFAGVAIDVFVGAGVGVDDLITVVTGSLAVTGLFVGAVVGGAKIGVGLSLPRSAKTPAMAIRHRMTSKDALPANLSVCWRSLSWPSSACRMSFAV